MAQAEEAMPPDMQSDVLHKVAHDFLQEQFSRQALRDRIIAVYTESFTHGELLEILRQTPIAPNIIPAEKLRRLDAGAGGLLADILLDKSFREALAQKCSEKDDELCAEIRQRAIENYLATAPAPEKKARIYIECRSNKLFRISEGQVGLVGDEVDLAEHSPSEWGALLRRKKDQNAELSSETSMSWYILLLTGLDKETDIVSFLVRDDSFAVFKKAQALAWCALAQVDYELLEADDPITFDSNGVPDVYAASDSPAKRTRDAFSDWDVPLFSQKEKEPLYIDVHADQLTLYPGEATVKVSELNQADTPLAAMIARVAAHRDEQYIVLIIRPGSVRVARRLKGMIEDHHIDVGSELLEQNQPFH
ncbi:MAG: hypothetical protein PHP44_04440 [Kiritimatiellae bacterium]|nr:hypothetical protein [Kiritimatiellia bacterium]MDD4735337.1 hypothetical protein [Kiritimatiellia bacterium]